MIKALELTYYSTSCDQDFNIHYNGANCLAFSISCDSNFIIRIPYNYIIGFVHFQSKRFHRFINVYSFEGLINLSKEYNVHKFTKKKSFQIFD